MVCVCGVWCCRVAMYGRVWCVCVCVCSVGGWTCHCVWLHACSLDLKLCVEHLGHGNWRTGTNFALDWGPQVHVHQPIPIVTRSKVAFRKQVDGAAPAIGEDDTSPTHFLFLVPCTTTAPLGWFRKTPFGCHASVKLTFNLASGSWCCMNSGWRHLPRLSFEHGLDRRLCISPCHLYQLCYLTCACSDYCGVCLAGRLRGCSFKFASFSAPLGRSGAV